MKEILMVFLMVCIGVWFLLFVNTAIQGAKNEFTYRNHIIICDAIYAYHEYLIEAGPYDPTNLNVTFEDMEDYDATIRRFWDWGYKRILPHEKFELIKPFIKQ